MKSMKCMKAIPVMKSMKAIPAMKSMKAIPAMKAMRVVKAMKAMKTVKSTKSMKAAAGKVKKTQSKKESTDKKAGGHRGRDVPGMTWEERLKKRPNGCPSCRYKPGCCPSCWG